MSIREISHRELNNSIFFLNLSNTIIVDLFTVNIGNIQVK